MKAVVLFGGKGTRVSSLSKGKNKALIEVHGKPVAYYVLKNLLENFKEIVLITTPEDQISFLGLISRYFEKENIEVALQPNPEGVADALGYARPHLKDDLYFCLCLGDFYCEEIKEVLKTFDKEPIITLSQVKDPSKYGVFDPKTRQIIEKPKEFIGNLASRGFYLLPHEVLGLIDGLKKSPRGEKEIVGLLNQISFRTHLLKEVFDLGSKEGLEAFERHLSQKETS